MAYEDSVLDREMFRSKSRDVSGSGITSLPDDPAEEAASARKAEASRLFDEARVKHDPSNFQTLRDQDKPGAFRPVQAAAAQMPQQNVQQQIAQMQAMGMRPVGMAHGGYIQNFAEGSGQNGVQPTVSPTGSTADTAQLEPSSPEDKDPALWTDEDIASIASERISSNPSLRKAHEEYPAKTPLGRGIQSLNPFSNDPLQSIIKDLTVERAYRRADKGKQEYSESLLNNPEREATGLESIVKAQKENPIPSPFSEVSAGEYEAAKEKQRKAVEETDISAPKAQNISSVDDYLSKVTGTGAPTPSVSAPQKAGIETLAPQATESMTGTAKDYVGSAPAAEEAAPTPPPNNNFTKDYSTDIEGIKADRAAQRQENINLSLIQAGLAMAGGTSPNALANIAQGGISGLGAYASAEKQNREDFRQNKADIRAQQTMEAEKAYRNAVLANQEEQTKFKTGPEFEYLKGKAEDDRKARIDANKDRTVSAIDNQIAKLTATLNGQQMMAASDAEKQKMQAAIDVLETRRYNILNGFDESTPTKQPDYSGFKITNVIPGAK
jgi:hypothetical protein